MAKTHLKVVAVVSGHDQPKLSKGQQAFNKLIEQIEEKRAQLADWEAAILRYQKKYTGELLPLVDDLMDRQVRMVHCLDRASVQKGLSKTERGAIAGLIVDLADQLLANRDDAELKAIYNKHSHSDYDQEEAADIKHMKSMMEGVLGVDFGDDFDVNSGEEFLKHIQAKMQEEWAQENAKRQTWEERRPKRKKQPNSSPKKRSNRPKSSRSACLSARSTENWPAPCTRIAKPMRGSASGKPP